LLLPLCQGELIQEEKSSKKRKAPEPVKKNPQRGTGKMAEIQHKESIGDYIGRMALCILYLELV